MTRYVVMVALVGLALSVAAWAYTDFRRLPGQPVAAAPE
jgi:hypothetical protein